MSNGKSSRCTTKRHEVPAVAEVALEGEEDSHPRCSASPTPSVATSVASTLADSSDVTQLIKFLLASQEQQKEECESQNRARREEERARIEQERARLELERVKREEVQARREEERIRRVEERERKEKEREDERRRCDREWMLKMEEKEDERRRFESAREERRLKQESNMRKEREQRQAERKRVKDAERESARLEELEVALGQQREPRLANAQMHDLHTQKETYTALLKSMGTLVTGNLSKLLWLEGLRMSLLQICGQSVCSMSIHFHVMLTRDLRLGSNGC